ncbi:MAG: hypothetical protein ACK5LC_06245 [Coprobacillaceae bacterium]
MTTIQIEINNRIREDFINALIDFSNGKVSTNQAIAIADSELRLTDFADGSPLTHKGPRWLAKNILRAMKIID